MFDLEERSPDLIVRFRHERMGTVEAEGLDWQQLAYAGADCRWVLVDLSRTNYIASTMLSNFLQLRTKLAQSGAELILTDVDDGILEVFRVTQLDRVLRIEPTVDDVLGREDDGDGAPQATAS